MDLFVLPPDPTRQRLAGLLAALFALALPSSPALAGGNPCLFDATCAGAETCIDYVCQPAPPCEDCEPEPAACSASKPCPVYQSCDGGLCVDKPLPECGKVYPCERGLVCVAGECVEDVPECGERLPCSDGRVCRAGHCEAPPVVGCRSDTECRGGVCDHGLCVPRYYDPPPLVPLTLPDPPTTREVGDLPPVWDLPDGDDPFGDIPPNRPAECGADAQGKLLCCSHVSGWSFEKDEVDASGNSLYQAWTATGVFGRGPVYGNNVHIDRIDPPGYTASLANGPGNNVGGDYWAYSRDVNQQGKWWIGSSDMRPSPKTLPGGRQPDEQTGTLQSPRFIVDTSYIRFFIGGDSVPSQRVQLEIYEPDAVKRAALGKGYEGIGVTELINASSYLPVPPSDPDYVVVRASSPKDGDEYMHRRVAWNVSAYKGRIARITVVDSDKWGWHPAGAAHINMDEVICTNDLDDAPTWDLLRHASTPGRSPRPWARPCSRTSSASISACTPTRAATSGTGRSRTSRTCARSAATPPRPTAPCPSSWPRSATAACSRRAPTRAT